LIQKHKAIKSASLIDEEKPQTVFLTIETGELIFFIYLANVYSMFD